MDHRYIIIINGNRQFILPCCECSETVSLVRTIGIDHYHRFHHPIHATALDTTTGVMSVERGISVPPLFRWYAYENVIIVRRTRHARSKLLQYTVPDTGTTPTRAPQTSSAVSSVQSWTLAVTRPSVSVGVRVSYSVSVVAVWCARAR